MQKLPVGPGPGMPRATRVMALESLVSRLGGSSTNDDPSRPHPRRIQGTPHTPPGKKQNHDKGQVGIIMFRK